MRAQLAIVDLFAGPGGLAEGFASIRNRDGSRPFRVVLSIEKDVAAFETLRLRAFLRQFPKTFPAEYYSFINGEVPEPNWSSRFPKEWESACHETMMVELGSKGATSRIDTRLSEIKLRHGRNIVLIGGPPCQAYSLVGRARNKGTEGYEARNDGRHFLYREYVRILKTLTPAAFVMENVKGLLSSSVDGERVFDRVLDDLSEVGGGAYRLVPLAPRSGDLFGADTFHSPPADFIVRAEDFGIPQSRHRVIIVGIHKEVADRINVSEVTSMLLAPSGSTVNVQDVLKGMPKLRSGLSTDDSDDNWQTQTAAIMDGVAKTPLNLDDVAMRTFRKLADRISRALKRTARANQRSCSSYSDVGPRCPPELRDWLVDRRLSRFSNHETRGHMSSDLGRYFFAALYGRVMGVSPKAKDFPRTLAPYHRNWKSGKFADRFRVQLWKSPATTITSHISKDGHYFIHPDASQCRSLTVREAARLQTFPDNYYFKGNRTQQFIQVGNAVPPFLARKIACSLHSILDASGTFDLRQGFKKVG